MVFVFLTTNEIELI